jgi:hypothetical protein
MKTIKQFLALNFFLICFTSLLLIISCSKPEDGKDGAIGPAGYTNVIYSNWANLPATTTTITIDGTLGNTKSIAAPQLSQEILDQGTVLVYGRFADVTFTLPYVSNAGGSTNTLTFFPELNNIKLFRFKHDGTGGTSISSTILFRYILIPGGVTASKMTPIDYKKMTYEEICNYLGIKKL